MSEDDILSLPNKILNNAERFDRIKVLVDLMKSIPDNHFDFTVYHDIQKTAIDNPKKPGAKPVCGMVGCLGGWLQWAMIGKSRTYDDFNATMSKYNIPSPLKDLDDDTWERLFWNTFTENYGDVRMADIIRHLDYGEIVSRYLQIHYSIAQAMTSGEAQRYLPINFVEYFMSGPGPQTTRFRRYNVATSALIAQARLARFENTNGRDACIAVLRTLQDGIHMMPEDDEVREYFQIRHLDDLEFELSS